MRDQFMNYTFLVEFEENRRKKIIQAHQPSGEVYAHMIDLLFCMGYCKGKLIEDKNHWIYTIQDVAQFYFMESAYSFRVLQTLLLTGNFSYASIILRTMLDSFAAYRFYMNKKDGNGYVKFINRKSTRSWKDIYDCLSEGFYEHQYSLLSNSVHSNPITHHIYRLGSISDKKQNYVTDDVSIDFYSGLYNQAIHLFKGIFKMFFDIFPENSFENEGYTNLAKSVMEYIDGDILYRLNKFPKQEIMINEYNELTRDFKDLGIDFNGN